MTGRRPHGGRASDGTLDFSDSVNPLGPPEGVRRLLKESLDLTSYPYQLRAELREEIARKNGLDTGNVLIGAGTSGLIQLIVQGIPGQRMSVLVPTFTEYEDLGRTSGWSVNTIKFHPPFERSVGDVKESIVRSDLIVICNPNNPTGTIIESDRLMEWVRIVDRSNTFLIVDEAYMPFLEHATSETLLDEVGRNNSLIVLRSFTKFYGIPGLRVGFLAASPETVDHLRHRQNPWPVGEPALRVAGHCLKSNSFVERSRKYLQQENQRIQGLLESFPDISSVESCVNFILFRSSHETLQSELKQQSLTVRDASTFTGLGAGWWRIGLQKKFENEQFLDVLQTVHQEESHA